MRSLLKDGGGPSCARALRALRAADAPRPRRPAWRLSAPASAAVALAALALVASAFAASDRVTVGRDVTVHGQTIHLGDVAALEGERAQALASVQLGTAPGAGESRTLDGMVVLEALRREVGDLDSITYTIPPMVRVHRATQELTETAVRGVVEAYLRDALGAGAGEAELRTVELPGPVRIPAGPWTGRVIAPPGAPLLGRVRLQVELSVEERPV